MNKINKKGDYKYGIILSLILGLIVLSLSLFFIFNEYFSEEDTGWQICRQSIQVRNAVPDVEVAEMVNAGSFKDKFPLKCKTRVVEINEEDVEKDDNGDINKEAGRIIAEMMTECWALYDSGDEIAFPEKILIDTSVCVPCARIHLTEEAQEYMKKNRLEIDIRSALNEKMEGKDYTYFAYLRDSGKKFPALGFASSGVFNLSGASFDVGDDELEEEVELKNRVTGGKKELGVPMVSLPRLFDIASGDLLINYGVLTGMSSNLGEYIPYLFYFQVNQKNDPFKEVGSILIYSGINDMFCENWEGVPA